MHSDQSTIAELQHEIESLRRQIAELEVQAAASKQAVVALQQSEARFAALFRASPVAVVISTLAEGRYLDVNDSFCALTGYRRDEVLGRSSSELRIWISSEQRYQIGQRLAVEHVVRDVELPFRTKTQEVRTMLASLALIELEGTPCVLTMCHDITEREQIATERERLLQETQQAVLMRDDFLSIASHELKTPLTAIQLYLENVQRLATKAAPAPDVVPRIANKLGQATAQTERLAQLINTLLDVTRIRTGHFEIELTLVDLAGVVQAVVPRFAEQAARIGSEITVQVDPPSAVYGDWLRLDQVVTNLLANALKYGAGQPVEVAVIPTPSAIQLKIRDYGIGIAPKDQARIFERFGRAVSSQHYGGLGLGLFIVQHIVTSMGGTISVESQPGAGATFTVSLPHATAAGGNTPSQE